MAESSCQKPGVNDQDGGQVEVEMEKRNNLKYLGFVQVAALQTMACLSSLYSFAKENAGPLKSGVRTVEGTVKTVVGPVYDRLHDVPFRILKFVDSKVDDTLREVNSHLPSLVKQASCQAYTVAGEVRRTGVIPTATNAAKTAYQRYGPVVEDLYNRYEPVGEKYMVVAWRSLNRLPFFPKLAHIVVLPTASYFSDKYNRTVCLAAERGYMAAEYLPLIPKERIAKVFSDGGSVPNGTSAAKVAE